MNSLIGNLQKLSGDLASPVNYTLPIGEHRIFLNSLLGKKITLRFLGEIHCIRCGRKTAKSFQQGHCFPCHRQLLECNCHVQPENCRFYEGNCDANHWAHAHCGQAHFIYFANSSSLKVGITRESHIPSRWIDQGASQGLAVMRVSNRYQAGLIEVALKKYVNDKTNWRLLLTKNSEALNLKQLSAEILLKASAEIAQAVQRYGADIQPLTESECLNIHYPVHEYPQKIVGLNFDKSDEIEGQLQGIKGQYLILDIGVLNIRKFAGYQVELTAHCLEAMPHVH